MQGQMVFTDPYIDTSATEENNGSAITFPQIDKIDVRQSLRDLRNYSKSYFSSHSPKEIRKTVETLDKYFSDLNNPEIKQIIEMIHQNSGFSVHDIKNYGLGIFPMLVDSSKNDGPNYIEKAIKTRKILSTTRGYLKRYGFLGLGKKWDEPGLVSHFISGNVVGYTALLSRIGLPIKSMGSGQVLKLPSASAFFPLLYLEKLNSINPELRKTMLCAYWKGGDDGIEEPIIRESDAINILSSDAAIADLKLRIRKYNKHLKTLFHGHKIGIAYIASEFVRSKELREQTIGGLVKDISAFDGGACYTVKNIYVQGDHKLFAEELHARLEEFAGHVSPVSASSKPIANSLAKIYAGYPQLISTGKKFAFVRIKDKAEFWQPDELYRYVQVMPVKDEKEVYTVIKKYSKYLQTAITAVSDEKILDVFRLFGKVGISNMHYPGSAALFNPYEEPHDCEFDFIKIRYNYSGRFSATNFRENKQWLY